MKQWLALVALVLTACPRQDAQTADAGATASSAPSAPSASSAPSATSIAPSASSIAPSASSSAADEAPPAWLNLKSGDTATPITTGPTQGCYKVKLKAVQTILCPPLPSPAATVDDVDIGVAHSCPTGFTTSGSHYCTRECKKNSDCHGNRVCEPTMLQCLPR
jgi:hypothetical protein